MDPAAVAAVAEKVAAGTDSISVPEALVKDPEHPTEVTPGSAHESPLWLQVKKMNMGERIKLAMRGNKEARVLLLRDINKQIQKLVLQNPRISEDEILMISKDRNTDEEILALLADDRDWTKVYAVRVALVENARTPVAKALRLLATLDEKELGRLGKSKSIPNVVAVQARRLVHQMRDRR